ncbi:MAG: hypothetical protein CM1200mP18_07960 [Gammaproteobacteria bacterium]|nr:MAG: hypothetical protein CM1200mP18_07960 [Gammaproteobacteria bacterium]
MTGRIVTPEQAKQILQSGAADLIGMTRALIADPDLQKGPKKPKKTADIRVCMGSNKGCIDRLYLGYPLVVCRTPLLEEKNVGKNLHHPKKGQAHCCDWGGHRVWKRPAWLHSKHRVTYSSARQLGGAIRRRTAPGWESYLQCINWLEQQCDNLRSISDGD